MSLDLDPAGPVGSQEEAALAALAGVLTSLLRALDALTLVSRYLDPAAIAEVMAAAAAAEAPLAEARPALGAWPQSMTRLRDPLALAADEVLAAFTELRAARDVRGLYRALRHGPRASEALFPLCDVLPPVSRHFLDPDRRGDADLLSRLAAAPQRADRDLFHTGGEPGARGGCAIFVPATEPPTAGWPLVMALHGGSGNGRGFLWSWLASARTRNAVLIAPTAVGDTWAIMGEDPDSPNLAAILSQVQARWPIDPTRLLLGGMSDGGTFTLTSGLEAGSPFTHLAPVACAFHPALAGMADPARLAGLPILLTHGARDWMFPIDTARAAGEALAAAGADLTWRPIDDLSHTWPGEMSGEILDWLMA